MKKTTQTSNRRGFKKDYELAERATISMPKFMMDRAADRARMRGLFGLSAYIQELIRRDLMGSEQSV